MIKAIYKGMKLPDVPGMKIRTDNILTVNKK